MIYVDEPNLTYRRSNEWCHMFSDELADPCTELHRFAIQIGLNHSWFQNPAPGDHPHYDVSPKYRVLALANGATFKPGKEWIRDIVRPRRVRKAGYRRPADRLGMFQAITDQDAVQCFICLRKSMIVFDFDADSQPTIQLCAECAHKVDGKVYLVSQKEK